MKILSPILICLMFFAAAVVAQIASDRLFYSPGEITSAALSDYGLIVANETAAVLEDLRASGLTDAMGTIPNLASNQRNAFACNGEKVMRLTYTGAGDYVTVEKAELFDLRGNRLLELENPGFSEARLTDIGAFIGIDRNINVARKSRLLFFNSNGDLLNEVNLPAITQVEIDPSGNAVAAVSGERGLVIYTLEGQEIADLGNAQWFELKVLNPNESEELNIACAYSDGQTINFFQNAPQNIEWNILLSSEVFRDISLAVEGETAFITAVTKHNLYCLDAYSKRILLQKNYEAPINLTSCAVNILPKEKIAVAYGWEIDRGRSVDFANRHIKGGYSLAVSNESHSDFTVSDEELSYSRWNVFTPAVKFHQENLMIQTMDEVRVLKLNQGDR